MIKGGYMQVLRELLKSLVCRVSLIGTFTSYNNRVVCPFSESP